MSQAAGKTSFISNLLTFLGETFPPHPVLTEANLPDQTGRVFLITGASSGVGKELAQILYSKNGKVYLAARSQQRAESAIEAIKSAIPSSNGSLTFLPLDLEDLVSVKQSAQRFLEQETRLDVLFNNAGVLLPPAGSKTKQGYELQIGVNTVAPFLFTQLLTPLLKATARQASIPRGSVRVVWVSSSAAYLLSPEEGVDLDQLDGPQDMTDKSQGMYYGVSKAGTVFHAIEYAKRHESDGIVSTSCNPGNLKSGLQKHFSWFMRTWTAWISYHPIYGAYTELFAGFSPEAGIEKTGAWIVPWGRFGSLRSDLVVSATPESEGGTGVSEKFWKWSEDQVKQYM